MSDTSAIPDIPTRMPELRGVEIAAMTLVSVAMFLATAVKWWPFTLTEVLGFVTGGVCVWLTVREHIATWPIGLANNVVFLVLFWRERLFADATLQIVYFVLGVYGWWNWLYGGARQSRLTITRTTLGEWLGLLITLPLATWGMRAVLLAAGGAAPFWDGLTTALSLGAQFLLCRKRLEHWLLWIVADVIYMPLYASRDLWLTAVLYGVFLLMCIVGWRSWLRSVEPLPAEAQT